MHFLGKTQQVRGEGESRKRVGRGTAVTDVEKGSVRPALERTGKGGPGKSKVPSPG